jgi:hypothetical protein
MGRISKMSKEERTFNETIVDELTNTPHLFNEDREDECEPEAEEENPEQKSIIARRSQNSSSHLTNLVTIQNLIKSSTSRLLSSNDEASSLMARTSSTDTYLNSRMETDLVVFNLLRDRCYQLYAENNFSKDADRAKAMVQMGIKKFPGDELTFAETWPSLNSCMIARFEQFVKYTQSLPGIDRINRKDLFTLLSDLYLILSGIFTTRVFINEQSYIWLPGGIQLTRRLLNSFCTKALTDRVFRFHAKLAQMEITDHELALLTPVILTMNTGELFFLNQPLILVVKLFSGQSKSWLFF